MSNVIVDRNKIDILANAIADKSGEPVTMTLDEMVEAVDSIEVGGGITPTGNINIAHAGLTDVTDYATASVPYADAAVSTIGQFFTESGTRKFRFTAEGYAEEAGWVDEGGFGEGSTNTYNAIPKNISVTPTESSQTIGGYQHMMEGAVTVNAIPSNYVGSEIDRYDSSDLTVSGATVSGSGGYYANAFSKSVASGSVTAPSTIVGTGANIGYSKSNGTIELIKSVSVTPTVTTAGYISSGTAGNSSVDLVASCPINDNDSLTASGATVSVPRGYYPSASSKTIASGTEGTPTATKGTVTNHSVSITPSVTNSAGYISGGTHNGTAVSVSASELVSGSQTITQNGTVDVTNLAEVVVDVQGGGGGGTQVATKTATPSAASSSIQFTGLSGNPTSFVVTSQADIATNTNGVTAVVFDGSSLHGQTMTMQVTADTGFTKSYSNGTLTITATSAYFEANAYKLVYTYGGSASDIETADVQVGSGATSITFPVTGRPVYWSCIFKSDFSTSGGYQRVIAVANDGTSIYGLAMDSSAHAATAWTASYSGGNLTINSQGTNNGGYFHQPGYYQLTYYVDPSAPSYQSKTVTPTTATQNVTPDSGYDALSEVTVNPIPSQYIVPTGNLPITQNGNNINVSHYATVSVNVSGGGGSSMNAQSAQSTTRATSTSYTEVVALTCAASGTYDVYWSTFRSSTSGTWGSQLYIDDTAYGTAQTGSWSNHIQNIHLTNVQIDAGEEVAVRVRSRGSNYYGYVGTLTIIQKS